ncbi:unnamed protein product [Mycena citricolor]|uniref:Retrotransposon gag domain-containing protein n=1 Tax=Mycena citricolor TaxID=2018698 RepID=A0AAD2Q7E6_9AGAR|nr:unnamed protein product [Mycena citricolor]
MQQPTHHNNNPDPGRVLCCRNSCGIVITTGELSMFPPGIEGRPVTLELTYAHVVSPASATFPKPVDASSTIGRDIASTPPQGEHPAHEITEESPLSVQAGEMPNRLHSLSEEVGDVDSPWTVATGRNVHTHCESVSSHKSSTVGRVSPELDYAHGTVEELTSIVDKAAASMSPLTLWLIANCYAKLASVLEQKIPAQGLDPCSDTTPESMKESADTGERLATMNDHPYRLEAAEWSDDSPYPNPPVASSAQEKGKGPDPSNWGEINICDSELEYQHNVWKAFELALKTEDISAEKSGHDVFLHKFNQMQERLAELEDQERQWETSQISENQTPKPTAVKTPTTLIQTGGGGSGPIALAISKRQSVSTKETGGFVTSVRQGVSLQPSDDSSSSSESSFKGPESEIKSSSVGLSELSGSSGPGDRSLDSSSDSDYSSSDLDLPRRKRQIKKKKKTSKRPKGKMLVKPNPPAHYNWSENTDMYTQFVDEANRYCELGNVPKVHCVPIVGLFLDGDAKKFYNRRIRGNEHKWTLKKMLWRLLKYCFSLDYQQKQHKRLNRCHQNGKSVNKHVLKLESILLQIGLKKDQERVALLWNSFDADIQEELFRFGLDPEKSRWKRVVKEAIRAEHFLNLDKRCKGKDTTMAVASTGPGKSGLNWDKRKRRFFPQKQGGIIKTAATAVVPSQGAGPRPENCPAPTAGPTSVPGKNQVSPTNHPWECCLSPQKRANLMTCGLCLNCEESGHMAC